MRTSIAMCTFNGARFLQQQLDSFALQTTPPHELIVCDDGSSDETLDVVSQFAATAPFPVRIFRNQSNVGPTRNFEQAIRLCTGDLIALADQDDVWYSAKLEKFSRFFASFPDSLVAFSNADLIDEHNILLARKLWSSVYFYPAAASSHVDTAIISVLFRLNNVATGATMVFQSRFRSEILPIPESWVHDAWIVWIAALRYKAGVLPEATIQYRIHPTQQLGLDPSALDARLRLSQRKAKRDYLLTIRRLRDLRQHLENQKTQESAAFIPKIDAKIRYLEGRAALDGPFLTRIWWILASYRQYHMFARGVRSMLKDMFFPSTAISSSEDQALLRRSR